MTADPGRLVRVCRSGGFADRTSTGELHTGASARGTQVEQLLQRVDLHAMSASPPHPDRYVFTIEVGDDSFTVTERDLTPELSQVIGLVLDQQQPGA